MPDTARQGTHEPRRELLVAGAAVLVVLTLCHPANAGSAAETAVEAVVLRFHRALASGDSKTVESTLAKDALIHEGGERETRSEYLSHHMAADMAFAKAIRSERGRSSIVVSGNTAWVSSTSRSSGTLDGKVVNLVGAELMVLTKGDGGWRIRAIHWSSRATK